MIDGKKKFTGERKIKMIPNMEANTKNAGGKVSNIRPTDVSFDSLNFLSSRTLIIA